MRIAAIQTRVGSDREKNIAELLPLIATAADEGARLVVLPEYFSFYGKEEEWHNEAEAGYDILAQLALAARRHSIYLHCGALLLPTTTDKVANVSVLFDLHGTEIARYQKINLFDVDLASRRYKESTYLEAGDTIVTVDVDNIHIGFATCFDLRFPAHFHALRQRGANVILLPSAFTAETGEAHWEPLLRARAIETQCYIVAPALWSKGEENAKECHGNTMIVGPWGEVIESLPTGNGMVMANINLDKLYEIRERMPLDFTEE